VLGPKPYVWDETRQKNGSRPSDARFALFPRLVLVSCHSGETLCCLSRVSLPRWAFFSRSLVITRLMSDESRGASPATADLAGLVDSGKDGAVLRVHVQPGARGEGIAGVHGNALKVRVRAPATSGRANEAVLTLLAKELGVPAATLALTSGASSRDKRVLFAGLSAAELEKRLAGTM